MQRNRLDWDDRESFETEFGGVLDGNPVRWDYDRFAGYGRITSDDIVLLTLDRNGKPGEHFTEIVALAPGGRSRGRTWHWFRDGELYQRTL